MPGAMFLSPRTPAAGGSAEADPDIGLAAAVALRRRTVWLRLALMAIIAALLGAIGGWDLAVAWWPAYAVLQAVLHRAERLRGRFGNGPIYLVSFVSFLLAGAPAWHMWSKLGVLGAAAASLYLSGMLAQLVASSLAARKLFLASAAPIAGYMLLTPLATFLPGRPVDAFAITACSLLLIFYLGVLWHGQQATFEKVRVSREAAESASRAKGDFLAMMSHEIRTPMNAVLGSADLLGRTPLTAEQQEHLDTLRAGGAALMEVLNDVLDFSKIEAGRMTATAVTTDLHELVERWAGLWRRHAEERGLSFRVEVAPEAPRYVAIDPTRTGQIVANLLSNAVKFTSHGQIVLSVDGEPTPGGGCEVRIGVSDSGIGMAPAVVERLFTPFEQADGSITRRFGGTGLGLAIGQKLAQLMGGEILVRSAEGAGSRFTLRLPAAICEAPERLGPAVPAEPAAAPGPTLRILVAEDHPANQRIIDHFLRPLDARVTIVGDGAAALERLRAEPFDVVLMDLHMPVMDGLQATRAVRAEPGPNRDTPILALTASALDSDRDDCLAAGMTAHVAKPIDPRLLLATILAAAGQDADAQAALT
jgi:signal transduction histidine kinase/ActR/RegA family two-component response regulator